MNLLDSDLLRSTPDSTDTDPPTKDPFMFDLFRSSPTSDTDPESIPSPGPTHASAPASDPAPDPDPDPDPDPAPAPDPDSDSDSEHFSVPPIPQINIEELPLELAQLSINQGVSVVSVGDGTHMLRDEWHTYCQSQGVGDTNFLGSSETQMIYDTVGSPYGDLVPQHSAPIEPHVTQLNPYDAPSTSVLDKLDGPTISKFALILLGMVSGTMVLTLAVRGLQTPSEKMLADQINENRKTADRMMDFTRATAKQNAKIAANSKGASNFCIGNCANSNPQPAPIDPTIEPEERKLNPDAVKLVARWRQQTKDPEILNRWAAQVHPGGKFGNVTSQDVLTVLNNN